MRSLFTLLVFLTTQTAIALLLPLIAVYTYLSYGFQLRVLKQKLGLYFTQKPKKYWVDCHGVLNQDLMQSLISTLGSHSLVVTTSSSSHFRLLKKLWPEVYVLHRPLYFWSSLASFWMHTRFKAYIILDNKPSVFVLALSKVLPFKSFAFFSNEKKDFSFNFLDYISNFTTASTLYQSLNQVYCANTDQVIELKKYFALTSKQIQKIPYLGQLPTDFFIQKDSSEKTNLLEKNLSEKLKKKKTLCLMYSTCEDEAHVFQQILDNAQNSSWDHLVICPDKKDRTLLIKEHLIERQQSCLKVSELDVSFSLPKILIVDKPSFYDKAAQSAKILFLGGSFSCRDCVHPIHLLKHSKKIISGNHLEPYSDIVHLLEQKALLYIYHQDQSLEQFLSQIDQISSKNSAQELSSLIQYFEKQAHAAPKEIQHLIDEI